MVVLWGCSLELRFIGSGSSSEGRGMPPPFGLPSRNSKKKEEARKKKRKVSPTTGSPSSRKLFDKDPNGFISLAESWAMS
ncbi:hypothetical protein OIU79_028933 [Salix purpurea]|uniref:Uncharacterized protein n=1 Tax=Salix purpurea TaxID=77065 RepID=A0A9Q1A3K4_SALPP|nr:hypothetical protein OIU79_028933 [Salix purpurea]